MLCTFENASDFCKLHKDIARTKLIGRTAKESILLARTVGDLVIVRGKDEDEDLSI